MPDLAMPPEPCLEHPLFGGSISCTFPQRFQDLSNIREVPDHQEAFADPNRDESLIIELLDLKQDVADDQSALWFLKDLASEQDSAGDPVVESVSALSPADVPFLDPSTVATAVIGQMAISKGRQGSEASNIVRVFLANLRLKGVGTDVLITAYEPLLISELSESARTVGPGTAVPAASVGCMPVMEAFKLCLATFKIHNWGLFGS
uniref:Ran guanine nucleotide release factor n=1 Tax=Araucaria cunninghamii TaxID=56994 RepID=A0A0D6R9L2_ARACU